MATGLWTTRHRNSSATSSIAQEYLAKAGLESQTQYKAIPRKHQILIDSKICSIRVSEIKAVFWILRQIKLTPQELINTNP